VVVYKIGVKTDSEMAKYLRQSRQILSQNLDQLIRARNSLHTIFNRAILTNLKGE